MPGRQPKSYDEILRGQQPAGEASDWDWPERAAARERAKLTPEERARLAAQERATDAFVRARRSKLKKESIMKTLRRVILEGGKNSQVKRTRVALGVQDKLRRGETTTADERAVLKKHRSSIHGMAAGRGLAKARKARKAGDDSEARMHAGGAKWNITRGKRWAGRKDPEQENSNTAYPLTADRVFMFEGKYKDQRMAAERGEAKGALRGPIAKAAIKRLKGSKGKVVNGKVKRATSKAARESYRQAARSEAGTSRPVKPPEDSLPHPKGGIAGSTEDIQNQIARRGHSR